MILNIKCIKSMSECTKIIHYENKIFGIDFQEILTKNKIYKIIYKDNIIINYKDNFGNTQEMDIKMAKNYFEF